jgi:hypothetical protein
MLRAKLTEVEAVREFRDAGLVPLEPYPGRITRPWRAECERCGREVSPQIQTVRRAKNACRFCARDAGTETVRSRQAAAAVEAMRAAGLEPLEDFRNHRSPWRSRCTTCGAEASPSYQNIKQGGGGCRSCGLRRAHARKFDQRASRAEQDMREAGLEPLEPYSGTLTPWRCRCTRCGEEVSPQHSRVKAGSIGCTSCALRERGLRRRIPREEAFALMETAGFTPVEPYPGAGEPWRCSCMKCGLESTPRLSTVKRSGSGCRFCNKPEWSAEDAEDLMRAAGLEPLEPFIAVNRRWRSRCDGCGNEVSPTLSKVRARGRVCRYCSGKHVDPAAAGDVMRAHGYEPLEPYPGSLKPWLCRCATCSRERTPTYAMVKSQGTRCAYCTGVKVDPADAERLMREAGLEPLEPYPGASVPWKVRCTTCERTVTPTIGTVRSGGRCRFCSTKGIQLNKPAVVYIITHRALQAHKVGIASRSGYRLRQHSLEGWETYQVLNVDSGERAFAVEAEVLNWIRNDLGAPPALSRDQMPQHGWTETVAATKVGLPELWRVLLAADAAWEPEESH